MYKHKILSGLKTNLDQMPNIELIDPASSEVSLWIGKTHALLNQYDNISAIEFKVKSQSITTPLFKKGNWATMRMIIISAISTLELEAPEKQPQIYGPGTTYDFYRDLKKIFTSSKNSLFIVDPYINEEVFDLYIDNVPKNIKISLLTSEPGSNLSKIISKYILKPGTNFEAKKSKKIHDRVIIIDLQGCWVLGQSIKDAAKKSPTYIVPLSNELAQIKIQHYQVIWRESEKL